MSNESWATFQNRIRNQKEIPTQKQEQPAEKAVTESGVEIPAEILAEFELYKARRVLEHLESKNQTETAVTDDTSDNSSWSIYDAPLNSELSDDDFDYIEAKNLAENNNDSDEDDTNDDF